MVGKLTTMTDTRYMKIKETVCEVLELDEDEVTETSLFQEDHGADSLRTIEILASVEEEFGIVIEQSEMAKLVNLKGVYDVVANAAGW